MKDPRILISAGEASGDLHAANLVRALRRLAPKADIVGLGGPRLRAAGARLFADTVEFGIIGVGPLAGSFWRYLDLLSRTDRFLAAWRPDVVVTIDCPGFHFLLASRIRARRIPLLWYIPPQLWAWATGRVHKLRRRFTHVACVLPHEEAFFHNAGVPATFVGHPVVDHLRNLDSDEAFIASLRAGSGERLVALLPGSRRQEIGPILARQLAVARALADRAGACRFVLALADPAHRRWTDPITSTSGLEVRTVVGKTHEVESAADLALVASGTATLELAFYGTPMAVCYNITWAGWNLLGRWLIKTPYLSLPNTLAGRRIVPEFMRNRREGPKAIEEISRLLLDEQTRRKIKADLAEVRRKIARPGTAENTARLALSLIGTCVPEPPRLRPGFAL